MDMTTYLIRKKLAQSKPKKQSNNAMRDALMKAFKVEETINPNGVVKAVPAK